MAADKEEKPPSIDEWISLRPTHLHPSVIPDESITAARAVFSSTLLPRQGHATSNPTPDGKLYIFGGRIHLSGLLNDLWLYSLRDNTATLIQCFGDLPSPRAWSSISVIGNVVFIWGGRCNKVAGGSYDNALYKLDLNSHKWTKIKFNNAPVARESPASATVGSTFYIFGGYAGPGSQYLNDIWSINLNTSQSQFSWRSIEPSSHIKPPPRQGHPWVLYQDQLITFGGNTDLQQFNDVWAFNLKTSRWTELPYTGQTPIARYYHRAVIIDDVMYISGGYDGTAVLGGLRAFKIPMRRWFTFETTGPSPRCSHTVVSVGSLVYVLGGWSKVPKSDSDVTYVFDTESIEELNPRNLEELIDKETEEQNKWKRMWEKQDEKLKTQGRNDSESNKKESTSTDQGLLSVNTAPKGEREGDSSSKSPLAGGPNDPGNEVEDIWTFV